MEPSQGLISASETGGLSLSFASLVDATRHARNRSELRDKIEETKRRKEKTAQDLDRLCGKFSAEIHAMDEALGKEWTEELSKQVVNFSNAAIQQIREKVEVQARKQMEEYFSLAEEERAKSLKGLETFLSTNLLHFIDRVIAVKLVDGIYHASSRFQCYGEIGYEFLLDSSGSNLFGKELISSGHIKSEIKIPVRIAKSWIKKDPVVDFVRLDQYVLTSAEATDTSLIASYLDSGSDSRIKIVYSRREGSNSFLTIEYVDGELSVNVSSNPALSSRLDAEAISNNMERIWLGISDLERRKTALVKLTFRDKSILDGLDEVEFFDACWREVVPRVAEAISRSPIDSKVITSPGRIDESEVRERLKPLGPLGEDILHEIGLASS